MNSDIQSKQTSAVSADSIGLAPKPVRATPPKRARQLAFFAIIVLGFLGMIIGAGTGNLLGQTELWTSTGGLIGGVVAAVGTGIVASLALRAMNEWTEVQYLEVSKTKP